MNSTTQRLAARLEPDLQAMAAGILKLPPARLDPAVNLGNFGFDSLSLKVFAERLGEKYALAISPVLFYAHGSIRGLSLHLAESHPEAFPDPAAEAATAAAPATVPAPISLRSEPVPARPSVPRAGKPAGAAIDRAPLVPWSARKPQGNIKVTQDAAGEADGIAIVGMAGIFPGSADLAEFWENLCQVRDLISEAPRERWDWRSAAPGAGTDMAPRWAGFIRDVDAFDAPFFRMSRLEAELMDPQQRLFLQTAWKAMEDAGCPPSAWSGKAVGVFAGVQFSDYQALLGRQGLRPQAATGNAHALVPNRVSYLLNLRGPSEAFDTACSGSLVAVNRAVRAIRSGECEAALAGGVSLILTPDNIACAGGLGILSPGGRCRTFDETADGYVKGEGVGVVMLKPLRRARADGDSIYAVIRASAVNHGGRSASLTAPNSEAQAELLARAYGEAGIDPATITYLETHGTATRLGDPVEIEGIKGAFLKAADRNGPGSDAAASGPECALGSVKANIGHLEPAAGIAGLIKVALALKHKRIPGIPHFRKLNPYIDLRGTRLRVSGETRDWETTVGADGRPALRRAGVSSFGFGGANAHVVLEEFRAPERAPAAYPPVPRLIPVSARNESGLKAYARALADFLGGAGEGKMGEDGLLMADIAFTLQTGRDAMEERLAVVASSPRELRDALEAFLADRPAASVFRGNVRQGGPLADLIAGGEAGGEFVRRLAEEGDLPRLARFWTAGMELDWSRLPGQARPMRIPLPTYPFAKERYWIPSEAASPAAPLPEARALAAEASAPVPPKPVATGEGSVSRPALERFLAEMVAAHLKMDGALPGPDQGFSDLGVDSVIGTELVGKINRALGLALEPTVLYNYPDLGKLAGYVASRHGREAAAALSGGMPAAAPAQESERVRKDAPPAVSGREAGAGVGPAEDQSGEMEIAIIGMSGRFPGAADPEEFWDNLSRGKDSITEVPPERWDYRPHFDTQIQKPGKTYSKWGGFLDDVDKFDPRFFGILPLEAKYMDPQQRLVLQEAWRAFEDAGYGRESLSGRKCGVFLGMVRTDYADLIQSSEKGLNPFAMLGNHTAVAPARVSYFLNLKGPCVVLDTACSSSLVSVHQACQSLRLGESEMALAGGVYAAFTPVNHILCSAGGMLSPQGICKTFDDAADGLSIGEAVGMVVLKPLRAAVADGDRILAVIKASGVNQDGKTNGITAPNALSQTELELEVYRKAGINPETIGYVEAHGTGTRLGDPVEIEGLTAAFRKHTDRRRFCAIGSVKPNIGHTYQAAGIASLIKVILSLRHRLIPPSIHMEKENRHIGFQATPFFVNTSLREWQAPAGSPLRAAISSFGYSGTNAHMLIEAYPEADGPEAWDEKPRIMVLSGLHPERVRERAADLRRHLSKAAAGGTLPRLNDLAGTLQLGRTHFKHRLAIVAGGIGELRSKLDAIAEGAVPDGVFFGEAGGKAAGPVAGASARAEAGLESAHDLAARWAEGGEVDWSALHAGGYRKVGLPGYPFEKTRCWVDAPTTTSAAPQAEPPGERIQKAVVKLKPMIPKREPGPSVAPAALKQAIGALSGESNFF